MKKNITRSLFIVMLLMFLAINIPANAGSPPPPPAEHGSGTNAPGGSAPVGEGLVLLVALGAAYGYKKWKATGKEE